VTVTPLPTRPPAPPPSPVLAAAKEFEIRCNQAAQLVACMASLHELNPARSPGSVPPLSAMIQDEMDAMTAALNDVARIASGMEAPAQVQ